MAKLTDTDQFIVNRTGTFYTVDYSTVVGDVTINNAKQGTKRTGVAGKMFPSTNFIYDEVTGMLDIDIPTSLNFVGQLETSYQPPEARAFNNGDFYLVNPDLTLEPSGSLTLYLADWTGVSSTEFYDLAIKTPGTEYRGDTGIVSTFGEGKETGCINKTNPDSAYGLLLETRLDRGFLVAADTSVKAAGFGYSVGDIIELKQMSPPVQEPQAYIKVTKIDSTGNAGVEEFEFIESLENPDPELDPLLGGQFLCLTADISTMAAVRTMPRNNTVKGSNLLVDITCQLGEIIDVQIAGQSGHTGFKDKDMVFVFNEVLADFGDSVLEIGITIDPGDTFAVQKNDKLIYSIQEIGGTTFTKWVLIKDSVSAATITDFDAPAYPYNDPEFTNPNLAIVLQRNAIDSNTFELSIKDAAYVYDSSGNIDEFNSYSGLLTPTDKVKLDKITRMGTVTELTAAVATNSYNGQTYRPLALTESEGRYTLELTKAGVGALGLTKIARDVDLHQKIYSRYNGSGDGGQTDPSVVVSTEQTVRNFLPNNFYALPSF